MNKGQCGCEECLMVESLYQGTKNPFYYQYIFTAADTDRPCIKWWRHPSLLLSPMMVQLADGYVFYYKQKRNGQIFLFKWEKE